jgi:hypothetical protein
MAISAKEELIQAIERSPDEVIQALLEFFNGLQQQPIKKDKLKSLNFKPDVIQGNPDDLVNISWEQEIRVDLP